MVDGAEAPSRAPPQPAWSARADALRRYGVAALLIIVATIITELVEDLSPLYGMVFIPAILAAAMYGGLTSGLFATLMSGWIIEGYTPGPLVVGRLSIWLVSGALLSLITEHGRRSHRRAMEAARRAKEAAEHLRESEARFRALSDCAPALIWRANAQGITYVNRAWCELTGRDEAQETGWRWAECVHEEDLTRALLTYTTSFELRREFQTQFRIRRHDGDWRMLEVRGVPRAADDGQFLGFVGTGFDITERLQAEQRLRELEKLEAVGRLAGGVAHDFNNVLMAVLANAQLLEMELDPQTTAEIIRDIIASAQRGGDLTRQLLTFSRRDRTEERAVSVNTILAGLMPMVRRLIDEDLRLEVSLDQKIGAVWADATHIEQIAMNLALNARDACPHGGTVKITTTARMITGVSDLPDGRYVELVVEDDGVGMDPETLKHIFEPFFTTKEGRGNGLGLATVHGAVKQAHGHIRVESKPTCGSRFIVLLPEIDTAAEVRVSRTVVPPKGSGSSVLLVEDELFVRQVLARGLQEWGYRVFVASNGIEALEIATAERIDVVVTDVVMPGMNGRQLGEQLAVIRPDLPVIYMSGYTGSETRSALVDVQYLQKPFEFPTLVQRLHGVCGSRVSNS